MSNLIHSGTEKTIEQLLVMAHAYTQRGEYEQALELLRSACNKDPGHSNAWTCLGFAYHSAGNHKEAIGAFRNAMDLGVDNAEIHNAMGVSLLGIGEVLPAVSELNKAVRKMPGSSVMQCNLGNACRKSMDLEGATIAYAEAIRLNAGYVDAYFGLAAVMQAMGNAAGSENCLKKIIELCPESARAYTQLGSILVQQGRMSDAERVFCTLMDRIPGDVSPIANLAVIHEKSGRVDAAWEMVEKGLRISPDNAILHMTAAKCERSRGQYDKAIRRLESLSLDAALTPEVRSAINYELGFLYDHTGDVDKAWSRASSANLLLKRIWQPRKHESEDFFMRMHRLADMFTPENVNAWIGATDFEECRSPVFLLGFLRSGTTLLDLMLDGHNRICLVDEKPTVQAIQDFLSGLPDGYPECVASLTQEQISWARQRYYDAVGRYQTVSRQQIVVDKMALNTARIGLIWRIFPRARFIMALRHPCDVCLSCFRQNFSLNASTSNCLSMEGVVHMYTEVMDTWMHYVHLLPLRYHVVRYEDLVNDLENEARGVVDFLGYRWDPAVMDYITRAKSRERVSTPSYTDVVKPVYQYAVNRWVNYRTHLEPYLETLAPYINAFGYEPV